VRRGGGRATSLGRCFLLLAVPPLFIAVVWCLRAGVSRCGSAAVVCGGGGGSYWKNSHISKELQIRSLRVLEYLPRSIGAGEKIDEHRSPATPGFPFWK